MTPLLQELLFGSFSIPENFTTRKHSICGNSSRKKPATANAKDQVWVIVNTPIWKTNKQIAEEAHLLFNCVQRHTLKFFELGKIERKIRNDPGDIKPVYLYRVRNGNLDE